MLRNALAISFVVLSLTGCVTGPRVNVHTVGEGGFDTTYGKHIAFDDPATAKLGLACVSADDMYRIVKECRLGAGAPNVFVCAWGQEQQTFYCQDETKRKPEDMLNWACLTARGWNLYLTYCRRKTES